MELALTWDLLVIVFFAIVVAYSFIVGKDEAVKIVIASYIALVAMQAVGNLMGQLVGESQPVAAFLGLGMQQNILSTVKLCLFVAMIIGLSVMGGFEMDYMRALPGFWEPAATAVFGFATAGLLLSALLTYIAATPILDGDLASAPFLLPIVQSSPLVRIMVDYQNVWFALPALLLLTIGIVSKRTSS